MVRSSFSILFFIRDSRVRKDGTAPIEVVLTENGERCAFSTGKRVRGFIITAELLHNAYFDKVKSLKEMFFFSPPLGFIIFSITYTQFITKTIGYPFATCLIKIYKVENNPIYKQPITP